MSGRNIAELRAALELTGWRLATTQRLAQVGDWTLDRDSGRMTWSRELFRMLERPQHLGEPDINEVLSYYTPSSLDRTRDLFWHAIDTGDRCSLEQEVLLPSGKQRHHFTVIEPHKDASGRVVRLYGTVQDITTRKRLEAERIRQLARVAELSRHMIEIEERERRQLASALHDRASPNLAALRILFANLADSLPTQVRAACGTLLEDVDALLADTTAGIREICTDLRPATLDYAGLEPALREYVEAFRKRTRLDVVLTTAGAETPGLAAEAQTLLFRLVKEALTNCAKHACAGQVRIGLEREPTRTRLSIVDDGVGFELALLGQPGSTPGLGLITMRERVELAGGQFVLMTKPGEGTAIQVSIPHLTC
ncbi:ATP-binding protein [Thauera mechernichensis]|uniref:Oxygen sensor histidine kinase NreB n=1 Tax=Thauera mechernichensis TaxID=82788 RepID=A0ABW3WEI5_9RHOO|nr:MULTISPECIES: ATP-binding protein [Thauera]ENO81322.1 PAS domain-containing protein/PAC sensor signal transduction histidine kinase [Thauera sp. 27]MDG3064935.1 ATP-binding protein [Thauera mechernichensis]